MIADYGFGLLIEPKHWPWPNRVIDVKWGTLEFQGGWAIEVLGGLIVEIGSQN